MIEYFKYKLENLIFILPRVHLSTIKSMSTNNNPKFLMVCLQDRQPCHCLLNDKILDLSKFEAFADDKLTISRSDRF